MRRLALVLLPCAVAVLVHLWLAQRPSSTPPDNHTHSGTFLFFLPPRLPTRQPRGFDSSKPRNFLSHLPDGSLTLPCLYSRSCRARELVG